MRTLIEAHKIFVKMSRPYKSPRSLKENALYYAFYPVAYSLFMSFYIRDLLQTNQKEL